MSLIDLFLSLGAPHHCLGCGRDGSLLCPDCAAVLPPPVERCYSCQQPSPDGLTCVACPSPLRQVQSVSPYQGLAKQLIGNLKYHGAVAAARPMACSMSDFVRGPVLVAPVPTSNARRRQRSYDQAELLARQLSRLSRQPMARLLARSGEAHQVGANRRQRQAQLQGVFRVRQSLLARGAHILLIDDVVTTGSTLEAAAHALSAAGASDIRALTFAQA